MTPLMSVKDAAEFLSMNPATVYHAVKRGTLPHVRIGRSIRFSREALEEFVRRPVSEIPAYEPEKKTRPVVTKL